jgi:hypothetical protein
MNRCICIIVFLSATFRLQSAFTAAAEFPSEVGQVIDLLVPGSDNLKRACMLQVDGNNVPCDAVRYVSFKDGAQSIQFNRGSGHNPIVSFFGKHRDIDIISIDGIALKVGDQPAQARATGECIVSKTKNAVGCQARIDDGRLVIGTIFVDSR